MSAYVEAMQVAVKNARGTGDGDRGTSCLRRMVAMNALVSEDSILKMNCWYITSVLGWPLIELKNESIWSLGFGVARVSTIHVSGTQNGQYEGFWETFYLDWSPRKFEEFDCIGRSKDYVKLLLSLVSLTGYRESLLDGIFCLLTENQLEWPAGRVEIHWGLRGKSVGNVARL